MTAFMIKSGPFYTVRSRVFHWVAGWAMPVRWNGFVGELLRRRSILWFL